MIILVSWLVFFITLLTPPYQDLYRRYITTYYIYDANTSLADALNGKIDFLFYFCAWLLYKLSLPFYLVPAIFSSLSCYFTLSAANDSWKRINDDLSKGVLLIAMLCIFSFVNVIMIASTLRFGFAVALFIKGISLYYFKNEKKKGYLFFIISISCHVSMLLPLFAVLLSKFVKISWFSCLLLCFCTCIASAYILPFVLNIVHLGYINDYVTKGYLSTDYANVTNNVNTLVVQSVKWVILVCFLSFFMRNKSISNAFDNYVRVLIIVSATTALSVTIFNRYFIGLLTPLIVIGTLSDLVQIQKKNFLKLLLVLILTFNILVINIFLERRQIIMAQMWRGLYIPPAFSLLYNMDDFDSYLKEIDSDGNWAKNKLAN